MMIVSYVLLKVMIIKVIKIFYDVDYKMIFGFFMNDFFIVLYCFEWLVVFLYLSVFFRIMVSFLDDLKIGIEVIVFKIVVLDYLVDIVVKLKLLGMEMIGVIRVVVFDEVSKCMFYLRCVCGNSVCR